MKTLITIIVLMCFSFGYSNVPKKENKEQSKIVRVHRDKNWRVKKAILFETPMSTMKQLC